MRVIGPASPPIGHVAFCQVHPEDCRAFENRELIVRLDAETFAQLAALNRRINTEIVPMTDLELYGVEEHWTYPEWAGDCEDYALAKRRALTDKGWPESALLITVARDERGDGHAVLTVRTNRGDLILDNRVDEVLPWRQTPYDYVKRQSTRHAANWDAIDDGRAPAVATIGRR